MSEQSGPSDSADQPRSDKPPGADRSRAARPQQRSQPRVDPIGDLQRWFIRSSAKNMRNQFEDQVRRTFGGQRREKGDVWDVATTEIPPEVGEAPECQWCPICRAARHMRESGPGLAGQLTGAGDAVASAVQEAVRAFDALLGRAPGGARPADEPAAGRPPAEQADAADQAEAAAQAASAARPDSLTGEHGPVGWKPGDRLATAGVAAEDPWATATAIAAEETAGREPSDSVADASDGREHGAGDRG